LKESHTQFPFQGLIDQEYRLKNINEAIAEAQNSNPIRVAIRPG